MITPIIKLIACINSENYGIGINNDLLYNIPEDKKHFRDLTLGKPVIMGRKTQESLPKGYLDKRMNIVLTSEEKESTENIKYVHDIDSAIREAYKSPLQRDNEIMIIGGESVYRQFMNIANYACITHVSQIVDIPLKNFIKLKPDKFFPSEVIDKWRLVYTSEKHIKKLTFDEMFKRDIIRNYLGCSLYYEFKVYENPNMPSIGIQNP